MCETCGCGDTNLVPVEIRERLLHANDHQAQHNREHLASAGIFAVNLMGSPGSGKTALLEATAGTLTTRRLAAVSGDLATANDANRLEAAGIPSRAITTGSACHLDAELLHRAMHHMSLAEVDYFFIENVGNLVCPAVYDLGQAVNVVALSVTEGVDKPEKYPVMFRGADLVVLTKIDLLPHLAGVSVEAIRTSLSRVMPEPKLLVTSATSGEGIEEWTGWLEGRREAVAKG